MDNDFDKVLRDKLKDHKADYNSADWEQMEAMLPRKKARKPYELVALLLLALGAGGLWMGSEDFQPKSEDTNTTVAQTTAVESESVIAEQKEKPVINGSEQKEIGQRESENTAKQKAVASKLKAEEQQKEVFAKNKEDVSSPSDAREKKQVVLHNYGKGGVQVSSEKVTVRSGEGKEVNAGHGNQQTALVPTKVSSEKTGLNDRATENGRKNVVVAATEPVSSVESVTAVNVNQIVGETADVNSTEAVLALNVIEPGLIKTEDAGKMLSSKEALDETTPALLKAKKKIVSFAIGATAGPNFSFIDGARWTKPGYSVGVEEEIMFINRIGFAFTQSYAQRKYDGGTYPCPEGVADCPYSYTSNVSSVDFGIDVKANLVHKTKWDWYVKAGVANTVKIREEFTYTYPAVDTVTPPPLPVRTNFNGTTSEFAFDTKSLGLSADPTYAPDLTISEVKRYHMAFRFATGFNVALTSKMRMQLEAGHSFTQPTVGADDRRLQSFGINGSMFYRF